MSLKVAFQAWRVVLRVKNFGPLWSYGSAGKDFVRLKTCTPATVASTPTPTPILLVLLLLLLLYSYTPTPTPTPTTLYSYSYSYTARQKRSPTPSPQAAFTQVRWHSLGQLPDELRGIWVVLTFIPTPRHVRTLPVTLR